jgi:hypothetical protein
MLVVTLIEDDVITFEVDVITSEIGVIAETVYVPDPPTSEYVIVDPVVPVVAVNTPLGSLPVV